MTPFLNTIKQNVTFDSRSVHYNKRSLDGAYEIVARAEVDAGDGPLWREVCLDVQPNRTKALDAVRFLRGHSNA